MYKILGAVVALGAGWLVSNHLFPITEIRWWLIVPPVSAVFGFLGAMADEKDGQSGEK